MQELLITPITSSLKNNEIPIALWCFLNQEHLLSNETLKKIPVLLSMLLFFLYTGVELGLGHWIYSILTESRRVSPEFAGIMASSYWGMFTVGRIIAGLSS